MKKKETKVAKKVVANTKTICVDLIKGQSDFSKYMKLDANREVKQAHVNTLIDSFNKFGIGGAVIKVLRTNAFGKKAIDVLADGQNTTEAARQLGLPLNVCIVKLEEDTTLNVIKYIGALNNKKKSWSPTDFLNAYATNGIEEYKLFVDLVEKYNFTITDMLHIFSENGKGREAFNGGTFKFENEADSLELLDQVIRIKNIVPNKAMIRRDLYKVLRASGDYKRMTDAIIVAAKGMAVAQANFSENKEEFIEHLTKIYKAEFKKKKLVIKGLKK